LEHSFIGVLGRNWLAILVNFWCCLALEMGLDEVLVLWSEFSSELSLHLGGVPSSQEIVFENIYINLVGKVTRRDQKGFRKGELHLHPAAFRVELKRPVRELLCVAVFLFDFSCEVDVNESMVRLVKERIAIFGEWRLQLFIEINFHNPVPTYLIYCKFRVPDSVLADSLSIDSLVLLEDDLFFLV